MRCEVTEVFDLVCSVFIVSRRVAHREFLGTATAF